MNRINLKTITQNSGKDTIGPMFTLDTAFEITSKSFGGDQLKSRQIH